MQIHPKNIAGREIQRLRLARNLSQNDLATACQVAGWDISRGTLSKIEAGLRCVSDVELVLLAEVVGCSPNELLKKEFTECLKMTQG